MTLLWVLTYAVIFIGGPLIALSLMRAPAEVRAVRRLGVAIAALVVAAVVFQAARADGWIAAGMLWAAWVVSMALMGQVLRLIIGRPDARRWTAAVAAVGTTVPWFGILIAQAMVG